MGVWWCNCRAAVSAGQILQIAALAVTHPLALPPTSTWTDWAWSEQSAKKRDMTRAEWVSTTWLGWKACEGLRVECGLFMAPRLLMLPLLLLLVNVVVDAALGKQHFLVEPEDKVASRGARVSGLFVSCNSLIVVGLREHLFWCQNCQHLPLRAVLDGAEVKKLAKQFFITVFSCNICIISHHSITSVVHTVWILWQFVNGGNLF